MSCVAGAETTGCAAGAATTSSWAAPAKTSSRGGAGNDRLIGGPGKDTLACGGGRDRVKSGGADLVASSCEIVNGKHRSQGGGGGGGAPIPVNCRYVTKTVYVLGLNGQYTLEPRVVYECDGVEKPCPAKPDSPWRAQLQQRGGWRFHYAPVLKSLYRFTNDGVCGFFRGTRTTYPTGSLEYGETYPFAWSLAGNELTLQFVGGYVEKVQLLSYDPADDRIDRTVAGAAAPPYYGCASPSFPTFYLLVGICPP
jgi:Ca2+-binding RTX toxin-like protein